MVSECCIIEKRDGIEKSNLDQVWRQRDLSSPQKGIWNTTARKRDLLR
jgi:hypothetical protein